MGITKGTWVATSGNQTTGFTLTVPAGVIVNDIVVIGITNRDATTNPTCTDNEGAGTWTRITTVNANTNGSISIWWKRASANTNGKTVTVGSCTGSASGALGYYRGASLAASPFGTAVPEANASADVSQAGVTTARDGSMVIHLVGCTSNDTLNPGNRSATTPSTITEDAEGVSAGGSDCSLSFASDLRTAAGATGTISWTQAGGNGTGASLAIELLPAWTAMTASSGAFAFGGTAATLLYKHKVAADSGSFAFTGTAATLRKAYPMTASSGAFAFTGTNATLKVGHKVAADSGAFAMTGTAAALKVGHKIAADSGSFALTGTAADLVYTPNTGTTLTADSGGFAFTGTSATLKQGHRAAADSGAFSFTGTDAALRVSHRAAASSGSFAFTGTNATLAVGRRLAIGSGSFGFAGTSAALKYGHRISAGSGTFAFGGQAATLIYGTPHRVMPAGSGSFAVTGQDASLEHGRRVAASSGAFAFTGQDVDFRWSRVLSAGSGSFPMGGQDATLEIADTIKVPHYGASGATISSSGGMAAVVSSGAPTASATSGGASASVVSTGATASVTVRS